MKPLLEHLPLDHSDESFFCGRFASPYFGTPWHYHPELELVLIVESHGTRFIGNTMSTFQEGDLSLLGQNLPHTYKNPADYYQGSPELRARSIIVHFNPENWGRDFFKLPESRKLVDLFETARFGIDLQGDTREKVARAMKRMLGEKGLTRLVSLLEILDTIADSGEKNTISDSAIRGVNPMDAERLNAVFQYVSTKYAQPIKLQDVADLVYLTKTSFCRFFADRSKRTFSDFLTSFRLQKASQQLLATNQTIASIAQHCGFGSLAFFNRKFKEKYGMSPKAYRKSFAKAQHVNTSPDAR